MIEVRKRGDFLRAFLQAKYEIPDDWTVKACERRNYGTGGRRGQNEILLVTGAVYPAITRGPRKGQPNFRKPQPGTEQTLCAVLADMDAWQDDWEQSTGKCKTCIGSGQEWRGWSAEHGDRFATCHRCDGSGLARAAA
jgi:hypothetical protein